MPRLPADIRIRLKKCGGKTDRIELIRQPTGRQFWIRKNGKHSSMVPEATATQVAEGIRLYCLLRLSFDSSSRRLRFVPCFNSVPGNIEPSGLVPLWAIASMRRGA